MPDAQRMWTAWTDGLGAVGVGLRRTPQADQQLQAAHLRGWAMQQLAQQCLADWPTNTRSPSALVWTRLQQLTQHDPPGATPTPPRHQPGGYPTRTPMPDAVRLYLQDQWWYRPTEGNDR